MNVENTPFRLDGKSAVITGGGRGIGRATAIAMGRCGARVTVVSRTQQQLETTVNEINNAGGQGNFIVGDISSSSQVETLVEKLTEDDGTPDILVNNAGISPIVKQADQIELEDWKQILSVNLDGTFDLIRRLAPRMIERGTGSVITVTSIGAERALPMLSAYNASKAALGELTRTMAVEWAPSGVRVNAVAPAYIETEMTAAINERDQLKKNIERRTPMGRLGQPEEVAWSIVFLATDEASYITGHTLFVDGGWTCL